MSAGARRVTLAAGIAATIGLMLVAAGLTLDAGARVGSGARDERRQAATAPSAQTPANRRAGAAAAAQAEAWIARTLAAMSLDEKIGQMIVSSFESSFVSTDSDLFESLRDRVTNLKVGGLYVFGASDPLPQLLLEPAPPGGGRRGDPLATAVLLNRLQSIAAVPLLTSADFEGGVGYIW